MAAFHRCNRVVGALLQRNRNAVTVLISTFFGHYRTVAALLRFDSASTARDLMFRPRKSGRETAGRIGEVSQPASRLSNFTFPYSRLRQSTGIPLSEAGRLPPSAIQQLCRKGMVDE